jgi:hypothetical protein
MRWTNHTGRLFDILALHTATGGVRRTIEDEAEKRRIVRDLIVPRAPEYSFDALRNGDTVTAYGEAVEFMDGSVLVCLTTEAFRDSFHSNDVQVRWWYGQAGET